MVSISPAAVAAAATEKKEEEKLDLTLVFQQYYPVTADCEGRMEQSAFHGCSPAQGARACSCLPPFDRSRFL